MVQDEGDKRRGGEPQQDIFMTKTYMPAKGEEVNAIAFPFHKDGELVNIKYRDGEKNFKQEKEAEKVFYGYDNMSINAVYELEDGTKHGGTNRIPKGLYCRRRNGCPHPS